jgi:hypothetical protein
MAKNFQLISSNGDRYPLRGVTIIGRHSQAQIQLKDSKVSRRHAQFYVRGDQVWIRDEDSGSGTLVNGSKISVETALQLNDYIQIGDHTFQLTATGGSNQTMAIGVGALLAFVFLIFVLSSGGSETASDPIAQGPDLDENIPSAQSFLDTNGYLAGFTGNDQYGAVLLHESGERLFAATTSGNSPYDIESVIGAAWVSPDGESIIVELGPDGLPARAIFGDTLVLFENYGASSVDLAIVLPDGTIDIARDVHVDPEMLRDVRSFASDSRAPGQASLLQNLSVARTLRHAATATSIASCAIALGTTIPTGGLALLLAVPACGGLALEIAADLSDNAELSQFAEDWGMASCVGGIQLPAISVSTGVGCLSTFINQIADEEEASGVLQTRLDSSIAEASNLLEGTFASLISLGQGDFQANLRWSTQDDLDLHVIDPNGNEIYFAQPISSSGGALDIDANPGCQNPTLSPVENIYWPSGESPTGTYTVSVVYFAVCESQGSVPFDINLSIDGQVFHFSGQVDQVSESYFVGEFSR